MNHLNKFNLYKSIKKKIPKKNFNEILNFMLKDKKNNSEKINLILLTKIGEVIHNLTFSKKKIKLFIKKELANLLIVSIVVLAIILFLFSEFKIFLSIFSSVIFFES